MIGIPASVRAFVAREPMDMRRGFDALAATVTHVIDEDPQPGHLFVFFNRRHDRVKILRWDRSGYWLMDQRLEAGVYAQRDQAHGCKSTFDVSPTELALILEGIDLRSSHRRHSWQQASRKPA